MQKWIIALLLLSQVVANAQNAGTPPDQPPAWAKNAIWYQIFVERFNNGDQKNDPKPDDINIPPLKQIAPPGWSITPWNIHL